VRYAVVFTNKESEHFAGACHRLPDLYRWKTDYDYIIEIYKENFLASSKDDRLKILIHELHHICVGDRGKLRLRRHNELEDFCELPSHDKYSELVLAELVQRFLVMQKAKVKDP
jgi:predicted metallopeptidase